MEFIMKYISFAVFLVISGCLAGSHWRATSPVKTNTESEQSLAVLRPIEAIVNEKGNLYVDVVGHRINSQLAAPFEFRKAQFINGNVGWAMTDKALFKTA